MCVDLIKFRAIYTVHSRCILIQDLWWHISTYLNKYLYWFIIICEFSNRFRLNKLSYSYTLGQIVGYWWQHFPFNLIEHSNALNSAGRFGMNTYDYGQRSWLKWLWTQTTFIIVQKWLISSHFMPTVFNFPNLLDNVTLRGSLVRQIYICFYIYVIILLY